MVKAEATRTLVVSLLIVAVGIILLLLSYLVDSNAAASVKAFAPFLRDFGIAVSSTGLISVTYEVLLRSQLLEDHVQAIRNVLNPDAERLGISHIFGNRQECETAGFGLETLIDQAKEEIVIYAIAPARLFMERAPRLLAFLKRGGRVRLLLATPRGRNLSAADVSLASTPGALIADVDTTLREVRMMCAGVRGTAFENNLTIRWHDNVPAFGIVGIDVDSKNGMLLVELNGLRRGESERPTFQLSSRAGGLYDLYKTELEATWRTAAQANEAAPAGEALLNEYGVCLGWQGDLYDKALRLARDRSISSVTYYHYSGSIAQNDIQELLQQGCAVELITQDPKVALKLNALEQIPRIGGMVNQLKFLNPEQKANLTLRQSKVPNTVRGAMFGDELIVLGWYFYASGPQDSELRVAGNLGFGVLVERSNAAFEKARKFLLTYGNGLAAERVEI